MSILPGLEIEEMEEIRKIAQDAHIQSISATVEVHRLEQRVAQLEVCLKDLRLLLTKAVPLVGELRAEKEAQFIQELTKDIQNER